MGCVRRPAHKALLASVPRPSPGDRGHRQPLGLRGSRAALGNPAEGGALIPLLFSSQATFDLLISRTDTVALRCLWGSEVQARGAEK